MDISCGDGGWSRSACWEHRFPCWAARLKHHNIALGGAPSSQLTHQFREFYNWSFAARVGYYKAWTLTVTYRLEQQDPRPNWRPCQYFWSEKPLEASCELSDGAGWGLSNLEPLFLLTIYHNSRSGLIHSITGPECRVLHTTDSSPSPFTQFSAPPSGPESLGETWTCFWCLGILIEVCLTRTEGAPIKMTISSLSIVLY